MPEVVFFFFSRLEPKAFSRRRKEVWRDFLIFKKFSFFEVPRRFSSVCNIVELKRIMMVLTYLYSYLASFFGYAIDI